MEAEISHLKQENGILRDAVSTSTNQMESKYVSSYSELCVFLSLPWGVVLASAPFVSISLAASEFVVTLGTQLFRAGEAAICICIEPRLSKQITVFYQFEAWAFRVWVLRLSQKEVQKCSAIVGVFLAGYVSFSLGLQERCWCWPLGRATARNL